MHAQTVQLYILPATLHLHTQQQPSHIGMLSGSQCMQLETCRDSWLARVSPPPAAVRTYQERIAELSKSQPVLLVAHAYTQHMALLAGGQRTRQLVLGARPPTTGDAGTSLFVFEVRM